MLASRITMLKRIIVLCLLFGMMFGLGVLMQGMSGELVTASQTLASIGFTALFAFTVGEVFGSLKLPRVTGYILTGIVLGPHLSEVFSSEVVARMQMFNTLALGLIALSAGLELDMRGTWRLMKTLGVTIALKIVALLALVGGTFVGIEMIWSPFELTLNQAIGVGLIVATLGIGTSPAIALAILNDTKAKGRLSELLLSMAVLKDLVVVVSLAIAMAVVTALLSGGGFDPHALTHVAKEIGASVLAGAIIGGLTIAYIRFIHKEMLFFVVAMILGVAQISALLHLELLLVFIVAGFLVRNFSPYEHDLMHPLEVVALPVFVVFFTTAGANIDLGKTWTVLPVALALFAARTLAYFLAARLGSVICREPEAIKKHSWMSYLPQAGVTLGLVTIAVGKLTGGASPNPLLVEVAEVMEPLGVALVALNLLVGPVTVGVALKKAGEVPEDNSAGAAPGVDASHDAQPVYVEDTPEPDAAILPGDIIVNIQELPLPELAHADRVLATKQALGHLAIELDDQIEAMTAQVVDLLEQQLITLFEILPTEYTSHELAEIAMQWQRHAQCGESEVHEQLDALLTQHFPALIDALPLRTLVHITPAQLRPEDGNALVKLRAASRRAQLRIKPGGEAAYRRILLRQSARAVLEPGLLTAILDWITALANAQNTFFGAMIGALEHLEPRDHLLETMKLQIDYARARARAAWRHGWSQSLGELVTRLEQLDTPTNTNYCVSYSKSEPIIQARLAQLATARRRWRNVHASVDAHVIARASNIIASAELRDLLQARFILPEQHIIQELQEVVDLVIQRFSMLEETMHQVDGSEPITLEQSAMESLNEQIERCYDANLQKRLRRLVHQHGGRQLLVELQRLIDALVTRLPSDLEMMELDAAQDDESTKHLDLQGLFRQSLLSDFFTHLLREHTEFSEAIAQVPSRMLEALHAVQYALELVTRGRISREEEGLAHIQTSFVRGLKQLEEIKAELTSNQRELERDVETRLEESFDQIATDILRPQRFDGIRFVQEGLKHPLVERLEERLKHGRTAIKARAIKARDWLQDLRDRDEVRDLRIRRGIDKLTSRQMLAMLHEQLPPISELALDPLIHQVFSLESVDDRRLFVPRTSQSAQLLQAIERWKHGERVSMLVRGTAGSGKTSFIENHLFDMGATNMYRLDRRFWFRDDGILRALAFELGSREEPDIIARKLERGRHVVVIDGLELWLAPNASGFEQWRKIRMLMNKTPNTLWLVSVHDSFYNLLGEVLPWEVAFTDLIALDTLDAAKLKEIIELRHRLSGYNFEFPDPSFRQRVFVRTGAHDDLYYQELLRRAGQDVRAALYMHLRAMTQHGEDITLKTPRALTIPFIERLRLEEQAVLLSLLQFKQLSRPTLQTGLTSASLERFELLRRLELLGLIEPATSHEEVTVPLHLRRPLLLELSTQSTEEGTS
jgi:Kef-type K+ transport system membrane component KefB